jgi:hypothetical protein
MYRCGVYCAANACIEQVIQHGEVDVFQAVKTVRRHRPQLVENLVRKSVLEQGFILFSTKKYIQMFLLSPLFSYYYFIVVISFIFQLH